MTNFKPNRVLRLLETFFLVFVQNFYNYAGRRHTVSGQLILQAAGTCWLTVSGADESEAGNNPQEGHCDDVRIDQDLDTYLSIGQGSASTNQKLAFLYIPAFAHGKYIIRLQLAIRFR